MVAFLTATVVNQSSAFWSYVIVGYVCTFVLLGGLAVRTIIRGRRLSRQLPPEQRRWL